MATRGYGRGSLTSFEVRKSILELIAEAVVGGCREFKACEAFAIEERTIQRWKLNSADKRHGPLTTPANKITAQERELIIKTSISHTFVNLSPHQIVPRLADDGIYIASESTFYRVMKSEKICAHRGKSKPRTIERPRAYEAVQPNQIYSWDITYLQSSVRGQFYYLYLFLDLFSRKIVGWSIHENQDVELSAKLLNEICKKEKINKNQIVVHSDNGGPMKGATMLATMHRLGIVPSFSRPCVSDDNPFSESLFKTMKFCPMYPSKPFESLDAAIIWMQKFVNWYNTEHMHSGINFVTPDSKHQGLDIKILQKRTEIYEAAKLKKPERWSGKTRNWDAVTAVKLNPLKEKDKSITKEKYQLAS